MLTIAGLGFDYAVEKESASAPISKGNAALYEMDWRTGAKTTPPPEPSIMTDILFTKMQPATSPALSPAVMSDLWTVTLLNNKLVIMQLQCLLNAAMHMQDATDRFQAAGGEVWQLASAWTLLPVDGVIKSGTGAWAGRSETDTLAILSRAGIRQFYLGNTNNFGPNEVMANVASYVKAAADYVGPTIAAACDFPGQAAAEAAARAKIAAAEAAALKATEEERLRQESAAYDEFYRQEQAAEAARRAMQAADGTAPSPGMEVRPIAPGVIQPTLAPPKPLNWWAIGAGALGIGVLAAILTRH